MFKRLLITSAITGSTAILGLAGHASAQCQSGADPSAALASYERPADRVASSTIVETAAAAENFKTLVRAVKAAGLADALSGDGPFTVFAPTDHAFSKLPERTLNNLLKPENRGQLRAILTYHVVPKRLTAADVMRMSGVASLTKERLDIRVSNGSVMIDNATVTATDIMCSNGIIHVIDTVVIPAQANIVDTASQAGTFATLLKAAQSAGLASELAEGGPYTVLAPTDEAFGKLPRGTIESLLQRENRSKLAAILKNHVIPGRVYINDAIAQERVNTLNQPVYFGVRDGRAVVDNINIVSTNIDASNGVIHVIDRVIVPAK
jgi:uncharacterized surface protein with fasciclin (FAS1) repeats